MGSQNYPTSGALIVTFLENVKRYSVNRISGTNPLLINFNGEQMYVYIKNLSPAQLSNDNPDIWRIQLPKREDFEPIKYSDKLFLLLGYDYVRKVYTSWNPYWCKQRLNVAESCSMYSRYSLQKRVADTQKIEVMQLQNDGNVVCIPSTLLGSFIKNIKEYYPEETTYIPVGSSIQKRKNENSQQGLFSTSSYPAILFEKFKSCYNTKDYENFLLEKGYQSSIATKYVNRLVFVFENDILNRHEDLFLECSSLKEYTRAINRFCYQPDVRFFEDSWQKTILAALRQYLVFVEKKIYGTENIKVTDPEYQSVSLNKKSRTSYSTTEAPKYKLDDFGKLESLDSIIIDKLCAQIKGVDFPDYESIIKQVKNYYPEEATEKMTPADWMNLFDSTKWNKRRGRKSSSQKQSNISKTTEDNNTGDEELNLFKETGNKGQILEEANEPKYIENPIDTNKLTTVFDKKVTSYKYFWFVSILGLSKKYKKRTIPFSDILIRMAALAWPIVLEDEIEFTEYDMMPKILNDIHKKTFIIKSASSNVVESTLPRFYNSGIADILKPLLNNVPYRFLSPWIKFTTNEDVINNSKDESIKAPYAIYPDCIVIHPEWMNYFESHYNELSEFALKSFINYVKQYNSNLKLIKLMSSGWSIK